VTSPVAHNRKLKDALLDIGGESYELQLEEFSIDPGISDAELTYTYGGSFADEADPEPKLKLNLVSDWRAVGISRFLWQHRGETVDWQIDLHQNTPGEHVRWNGQLQVKPPATGGKVRDVDRMEVELTCLDVPEISFPSG